MIVMKFGGSSLESAAAVRRVVGIVRDRLASQPVVVVSAIGKTTNGLLAAANSAASGDRSGALSALQTLRGVHERIARELLSPAELDSSLKEIEDHFTELEQLLAAVVSVAELTPQSIDEFASFGERLSSRLVAAAFKSEGISSAHVDSRQVIVTDERFTHAAPLYEETYRKLVQVLSPAANGQTVVMGGFIGATRTGVTSTLGRGGSDFTGAIVGAGIGATEVQIWTDVDGMLTCDPRILVGGHRVKSISFNEAAELAYFGAKVLHPSTVLPAIEKNIPLVILNSRNPSAPGTRISAEPVPCANVVKSIACKRGISVVNVNSPRMLMASGFLQRIFGVFARQDTSVDMVATSEVSVSLTIDQLQNMDSILTELREFASVSVEHGQAIVCLVGENLRHTPGVASRIFGALENINIRMISQGASLLNVSFAIADNDVVQAVERLHREFFSTLDAAVFD